MTTLEVFNSLVHTFYLRKMKVCKSLLYVEMSCFILVVVIWKEGSKFALKKVVKNYRPLVE
jgi:hypothetical protein